jgi:TetR/AcrR family acrAB operon transcriptional repressor
MARKTKEDAEKTRQDLIEAARTVFHQHGVSRSTLEKIAQTAGVTRGAVYWHFKDKPALFFAMREDVFAPMIARTDAVLFSEHYDNPLDAIEASLKMFFCVLEESKVVRQVFEILTARCEYVDEFASVQAEAARPAREFLSKIERVYQLAADSGLLRTGLHPIACAQDTWAFTSGVLHLFLAQQMDNGLAQQIPQMISTHMGLRRQ